MNHSVTSKCVPECEQCKDVHSKLAAAEDAYENMRRHASTQRDMFIEKVQGLEEKLAAAEDYATQLEVYLHTSSEECSKLQAENLRLREALEFYAMSEHEWVKSAALAADKGYIARAALEKK